MTRTLRFTESPAVWKLYPRVLVSQKPASLKGEATAPRIEANLETLRIDSAHLAQYREICGAGGEQVLPLAYPHVLASGLHLALLSDDAFPLKLMGLVHIRNRIERQRNLALNETGALHCWLEGHRDGDKGQEFDLHTEWHSPQGDVPWREVSTFLARRRTAAEGPKTTAAPAASARTVASGARTSSFRAAVGLGRSYGWMAGDINPIHMSDVTARLFGFKAAIAHGMWSLARCAAELRVHEIEGPCAVDVAFKLPVFLPSWLLLEQVVEADSTRFALYDAQGEKPHLSGTLAHQG